MESKSDQPMPDAAAEDQIAAVLAEIRTSVDLLAKSADTGEEQLTTRALRYAAAYRKRLNPEILVKAIHTYIPHDGEQEKFLLSFFTNVSVDTEIAPFKPTIETLIFIQLLVTLHLLDTQQLEATLQCATDLTKRCQVHHKHTLSHLTASAWFYNARAHELLGKFGLLRAPLFAQLRTASLHRDRAIEATVINLLLRNYLSENLYEQADKFIAKSTFPERASISQHARYHYYVGRIRAIQLDYTEAYAYLQQALRKAPENGAIGFKSTVTKISIVVQLLMGDIPPRSTFSKHDMEPYLAITQAVRGGDPAAFSDAVSQHKSVFEKDSTYTLIMRLHHNVIKTGLRRINLSYSRISLGDVAMKLRLDSADDAEPIVAKAIKDGVINAVIDHDNGHVVSQAATALHASSVPMEAYHKRIDFCMQMHNDAVKAMQYPPHAHRDLEDDMERKEMADREKEIAQDVAEGKWDGDEDEDMM